MQSSENGRVVTIALYSDLGLLNKHGLSDGCWGGRNKQNLFDIPPHYRRIGDYIERVRIIRNEIQHFKCASMSDSRYNYNVPTFLLHVLSKIACYDFKPIGKNYVERIEVRAMACTRCDMKHMADRVFHHSNSIL